MTLPPAVIRIKRKRDSIDATPLTFLELDLGVKRHRSNAAWVYQRKLKSTTAPSTASNILSHIPNHNVDHTSSGHNVASIHNTSSTHDAMSTSGSTSTPGPVETHGSTGAKGTLPGPPTPTPKPITSSGPGFGHRPMIHVSQPGDEIIWEKKLQSTKSPSHRTLDPSKSGTTQRLFHLSKEESSLNDEGNDHRPHSSTSEWNSKHRSSESDSGVAKKRHLSAVFVEKKKPRSHLADSLQSVESKSESTSSKALRKPSGSARVRETTTSSTMAVGKPDPYMMASLEEWVQEEIAQYQKDNKPVESTESQRGGEQPTPVNARDSGSENEENGEYIVEEYVRVPARMLTSDIPLEHIGRLIVDQVDQELFFGQEKDSDAEYATDDEDSNAEDYYANDYPEEEEDDNDDEFAFLNKVEEEIHEDEAATLDRMRREEQEGEEEEADGSGSHGGSLYSLGGGSFSLGSSYHSNNGSSLSLLQDLSRNASRSRYVARQHHSRSRQARDGSRRRRVSSSLSSQPMRTHTPGEGEPSLTPSSSSSSMHERQRQLQQQQQQQQQQRRQRQKQQLRKQKDGALGSDEEEFDEREYRESDEEDLDVRQGDDEAEVVRKLTKFNQRMRRYEEEMYGSMFHDDIMDSDREDYLNSGSDMDDFDDDDNDEMMGANEPFEDTGDGAFYRRTATSRGRQPRQEDAMDSDTSL